MDNLEASIPAQVLEQPLSKASTRREFLKVTAKTGVALFGGSSLAGVMGNLGYGKESSVALAAARNVEQFDMESTEYWEQFDWGKFKQDLKKLPKNYQDGALPIAEMYEKEFKEGVFLKLNAFYEEFKKQLGPDRKNPELVDLNGKLYGDITNTLSNGSFGFTINEVPFLADRVRMIHSLSWFISTKQAVESDPTNIPWKSDDDNMRRAIQGVKNDIHEVSEKYVDVGALKKERPIEFGPYSQAPMTAEGTMKYQEDIKKMEEVFNTMPFLKQLAIKVVLYAPQKYGQQGVGEYSYGGQFYKGEERQNNFQGALYINVEGAADVKRVLYHEIGHMLDPKTNPSLIYYLKADQLVSLWSDRQKLLLDKDWGRTYPEPEKVFIRSGYPDTRAVLQDDVVTPSEFKDLTRSYPTGILASANYAGMVTQPFVEIVDPILPDSYPAVAAGQSEYADFSTFVSQNHGELEAMRNSKTRNIRLMATIALNNPERFNDMYSYSRYGNKLNMAGQRLNVDYYWRQLGYGIANVVYADALHKGDPGFLQQFSHEERYAISKEVKKYLEYADQEYIAEAMSYAKLYEGKFSKNFPPNAAEVYWNKMKQYLSA